MGIFRLSLAKTFSQPLSPVITILLFSIGISIISLLVHAEKTIKEQFSRNLASIDLVVGAKGSPLQLILSTVFHLDAPTGNISLAEANMIGRNPMVEKTIPISLGDNYKGYRIVGTTPEYALLYNATLSTGDWFGNAFEAVIGYEVARNSGLSLGDHFTGRHGFTEHGHHHDEDVYTVKGILNPTGTVIDRLILTTIDTYWFIHGSHPYSDETGSVNNRTDSHQHGDDCNHQDDHIHDENCDHSHDEAEWQRLIEKMDAHEELTSEEMAMFRERSGLFGEVLKNPSEEITALLVFFNTPRAAIQLPRMINDNTNMQAASPAFETHRLFSLIGTAIIALQWLAWIIIAVSALNLLFHLMNTLNQSIREIALLRAIGTPRIKIMALLFLQGFWIAVAGWFLGIIVSKIIFYILIGGVTQLSVEPILLQSQDLLLLIFSVFAGFLASLWPAIRAYRSDIHYILNNG